MQMIDTINPTIHLRRPFCKKVYHSIDELQATRGSASTMNKATSGTLVLRKTLMQTLP